MYRYNNLPGRPEQGVPRRRQRRRHPLKLTCLTLFLVVVLITVICTISASAVSQTASLVAFQPATIHKLLPTLTPTSLPTLTPTANAIEVVEPPAPAAPVDTPTATAAPVQIAAQPDSPTLEPTISAPAPTASEDPAPTATMPPPSPTPAPVASGWTISGVTSLAGAAEEGLLLMGELVNGTGAPQQAVDISGAFYDPQGEVAVDSLDVVSYVPVDPVPPDAHVPFELVVTGSQDIDRFDLRALSQPASEETPRQDFQFAGVEQWTSASVGYCVRGQVDNQGPPVQEYLVVLAIVYDEQGSVVTFGEYYIDVLPDSGGQSSPFELCLDPLDRQLSRHDLRAFGL